MAEPINIDLAQGKDETKWIILDPPVEIKGGVATRVAILSDEEFRRWYRTEAVKRLGVPPGLLCERPVVSPSFIGEHPDDPRREDI